MSYHYQETIILSGSQNINSWNGKLKYLLSSVSEFLGTKRLNSSVSAGFNISNVILGIGLLGLPYAMLKGSWMGIFLNIFAAFVCCSTAKMIVECLYEKSDNPLINIKVHEDYPDIGEKVWPKFGRNFVMIISMIEMFGASTLYVILLGSSTYTLFRNVVPSFTEQDWCIICSSLVLFTLFIKQLSLISKFSMVAILALMGTTISTLIYCIMKYKDMQMVNITRMSIQDLPISMGIIIFSYCAHPLIAAIEASMRKPEQFANMINVSFGIAMVVKLIFGIIPVLLFGKHTLQLIMDNLTTDHYGFHLAAHICVLITVFFSMPLVVFVISSKIDDIFLVKYFHNIFWPSGKLHFMWIFVSRFITLSTILFIGLVVPYFALVMSFIGSFTGTCLTFIFPCWFSLVLKGKELNRIDKSYRIMIIISGLLFGANGMIFAAKEMYQIYIS